MNPVALRLAASPFAQMDMMMVDPNNFTLVPQELYTSHSLPREGGLPPFLPTGQPPTIHANELHTFQGTPGQGASTDESCCAVRADEHDDGRSEQLDGLYSVIGKSSCTIVAANKPS
jgi:hypothetical protein